MTSLILGIISKGLANIKCSLLNPSLSELIELERALVSRNLIWPIHSILHSKKPKINMTLSKISYLKKLKWRPCVVGEWAGRFVHRKPIHHVWFHLEKYVGERAPKKQITVSHATKKVIECRTLRLLCYWRLGGKADFTVSALISNLI